MPIIKKLINVRSSDKTSATQSNSQFRVHLDQHDPYAVHHCQRIELISAIIPNSEYNINSKTKTFNYTLTGVPTNFTLPEGQKSVDQVVVLLNSETTGVVWTVDDSKAMVTATTGAGVTFVATDQDLMKLLGFHEEINILANSAQTGSGIAYFTGLDMVYIASPELSPSNMYSSDGSVYDVFVPIPIKVNFSYSQVFSSNLSGEDSSITYSTPKNISSFQIKLLDKNFRLLELNKGEVHMSFKVWHDTLV